MPMEPMTDDPGCQGGNSPRHHWWHLGSVGYGVGNWCARCGLLKTKRDNEGSRFHVPYRNDPRRTD